MSQKKGKSRKSRDNQKKIRVSHEMSAERKKAVKEAMKSKKEPKPEWDRINEPSDYKFKLVFCIWLELAKKHRFLYVF